MSYTSTSRVTNSDHSSAGVSQRRSGFDVTIQSIQDTGINSLKYPSLHKATDTLAILKEYINDDSVRVWVAGGALTSILMYDRSQRNTVRKEGEVYPAGPAISDWDVFSNQPDKVVAALDRWVEERQKQDLTKTVELFGMFQEYKTFENNHVVNYYLPGIGETVQIIKRPFESPEETIRQFDFTANMFAVENRELIYMKRALWDLESNILYANQIMYPLNTLKRIVKYAEKGIKIHHSVYADVAVAIKNMDFDPDNLTDNMFYIGATYES